MISIRITIVDDKGFTVREAPFLPINKRPQGELGYYYTDVPPLYKYAEYNNGEFRYRYLMSIQEIQTLLNLKPFRISTTNPSYAYEWKATIENAVICHYLLHRYSIKRINYLQLSELRVILKDHLRECMRHGNAYLYTKIIEILLYYKRIGYLSFYGYVMGSSTDNKRISEFIVEHVSDYSSLSEIAKSTFDAMYQVTTDADYIIAISKENIVENVERMDTLDILLTQLDGIKLTREKNFS